MSWRGEMSRFLGLVESWCALVKRARAVAFLRGACATRAPQARFVEAADSLHLVPLSTIQPYGSIVYS